METKRLLSMSLLVAAVMVVSGCSTGSSSETSDSSEDNSSSVEQEPVGQGVTEDSILVGNTATEGGAWSVVGAPFNAGIRAVFEEVNEAGGIDGREITLLNRDDGFVAATGVANTEQLVEDDEVFALVGHFGTPTVGATLDYIQEVGIPMVYAATGINNLYFQKTPGNPIMAVQPIYKTEGRILAARAFKNTDLFGTIDATHKLGVIYTADDAGNSIKAGIDLQVNTMGKSAVVVSAVGSGDYTAAVQSMKDAGVAALILATNQVPFKAMVNKMAELELNVPVLTSYVNASATAVPTAAVSSTRKVYANAWVDVFSETAATELTSFATTIMSYSALDTATATLYSGNSYAIAGYVAAKVFVAGLYRVEASGESLNWENYIAAMESSSIDFPLGGQVDFTEGKRWGVDQLSLLRFDETLATPNFISSKPIQSLDQIMAL